MKKILLLPILLLVFQSGYSQVSSDYAVLVTASVKETPPTITLHWPYYPTATGYTVYKKAKGKTTWTSVITTLKATDTSYADTKVIADSGYEYKVTRSTAAITAYGYIYAAVKLHADDYRGKLLLIVDSTFVDSLSSEINQLTNDISEDGWAINVHYVSRSSTPPQVKAYILSQYHSDSLNVKAVFLLGHVPVPYSGYLHPDAHPDHLGAWPADAYYGDIHGIYTDSIINDDTTVLARPENRNIIGDGKFDQTIIPGKVLLEIGRVDLWNMPAFAKTETNLLKQYLNRDHDYKVKNFSMVQRALLHDDFGFFGGEAFASSGWRNFAPMFGDTGIHEVASGQYFPSLSSQNYLWAYGCGGGNFQGAGGIGSTSDFAADSVKNVFTMLFGSYFGDWDCQNNFLRAPLASPGLALTCSWSGRPYWFYQHMVLGENIGYSALITQNNTTYTPYYGSYFENYVHIALMGDPTLRQHVIAPPSNVTFSFPDTSKITLHWDTTPDSVAGYYIYRGTDKFGEYDRVSSSIITVDSFTDAPPVTKLYYYYVKAVKWQQTPSGTYLNTSEGVGDSATVTVINIPNRITQVKESGKISVLPNPANEMTSLQLINVPMGDYTISVKDELGRTIYSKQINVTSTNYSLPINVKGWSAGNYFIQAQNYHHQFVEKMVVSR